MRPAPCTLNSNPCTLHPEFQPLNPAPGERALLDGVARARDRLGRRVQGQTLTPSTLKSVP